VPLALFLGDWVDWLNILGCRCVGRAGGVHILRTA